MSTATTALNWIDGEWIDSGHHRESIDPATYQTIGTYADGGVAEADVAIATLHRNPVQERLAASAVSVLKSALSPDPAYTRTAADGRFPKPVN